MNNLSPIIKLQCLAFCSVSQHRGGHSGMVTWCLFLDHLYNCALVVCDRLLCFMSQRQHLLLHTARTEGYSKLMLGDNCTRLAVKLLSSISLGRGAQAAQDTVRLWWMCKCIQRFIATETSISNRVSPTLVPVTSLQWGLWGTTQWKKSLTTASYLMFLLYLSQTSRYGIYNAEIFKTPVSVLPPA